MDELLTSKPVRDLVAIFLSGELNLTTALLWVAVATALSMVSGAIGGMLLAGRHIGYEVAAIIGSLFAPAGVIPAVILGLAVLNWLQNY